MYTRDTDDVTEINKQATVDDIDEEGDVEFFECAYCSQYNVIKVKSRVRRAKRTRHIRVDGVTWGSLKRFAAINNVDMNYALLLLLHKARTENVNYLLNEKQLIHKARTIKKNK